ncbi:hypothetical protein C8R43DRAFT_943258 [Mycena crocata]|nr:hypothetical protein C8R43DRAFT_943258 [Mycena crocata]
MKILATFTSTTLFLLGFRVLHSRAVPILRRSGHLPVFADTKCGYSPRCGDATSFDGRQPSSIPANGGSVPVTVPSAWVGRVFAKAPACGPKGEQCTVTEFNLGDFGSRDLCASAYPVGDMSGCGNDSPVQGCGPGDVKFTESARMRKAFRRDGSII